MQKKQDLLPQQPAQLEIEHVSAFYGNGRSALEDLTLKIPHGAQVAVVGPNGAGKSTLFKVLVGLMPVTAGRVLIHGLPLGAHHDCVAYVPQREEIDWRFPVTVFDVVMMGRYGRLGLLKQPDKSDHDVVNRALEMLRLEDMSRRSIADLSGGQQQRVFLARALAQEPHILLLDEPFNGVDVNTQETTLQLLEQLKQQHVTVMISTHDLNMASQRFEMAAIINHRLIALGEPRHVFTTAHIRAAFGDQVMVLDGMVIVDQCCPPSSQINASAVK